MHRAAGGGGGLAEEVVVIQPAIKLAADFSSFRAVRWTASAQEDYGDDVSILRVRVGSEPAKARAILGACAGLAQNLLFAEVQAQAAGRSVLYRSGHALGDLRDQRADLQLAFNPGFIADDFINRRWMLQVVKRAAIGDGRYQRAQLQRRHGDAFTKRAHLAHAAQAGWQLARGKYSKVLAFNVVTGQFAQAELVGVRADFGKAQAASHGLKISIVGVRQRLGQGHL